MAGVRGSSPLVSTPRFRWQCMASARAKPFHQHWKRRLVPAMEECLVGLELALGGQPEPAHGCAGELHRRLGTGGDEVAVNDGALVNVVVTACVPGRRQIF